MGGFAWVTLATNDSYSLGALILAHSLKQAGTPHQLAVLVTPGVTNPMREKLSGVFDLVQEVNILDSKDEANLKLLKRPELGVTFTKLHCWRLTQFDKCVFLDADTLVLQNCDELFEREELSAAPDVGWPDCFNSGVFVFRPSNETYEKLVQFALDKGSFDGGDQGLLNLYFSDWAHKDISKHLPFIYNMCSTACYSYLPAFKQFGGNAKIIHFIGPAKPWLQFFDSETRLVHPSGDLHHLQSVLQQWWNIFCEKIHPVLSRDMKSRNTSHTSSLIVPPNPEIPVNPEIHDFSSPVDYQNVWNPWDEYDRRQTQNVLLDYQNQKLVNTLAEIDETRHLERAYSYHSQTSVVSIESSHSLAESHHTNSSSITASHESSSNSELHSESHSESQSSNSTELTDDSVSLKTKVSFHDSHEVYPITPVDVLNSPMLSDPYQLTPDLPTQILPPQFETTTTVSNHTVLHTSDKEEEGDAGLAGAFAQLTLGAPRSAEQIALENHLRRQGWEVGNIDYLGKDSFDNIWSKICETIGESKPATEAAPAPPTPSEEPAKPKAPTSSEVQPPPAEAPAEEAPKEIPTTQVLPPTPGTPVDAQIPPVEAEPLVCPIKPPEPQVCPIKPPEEPQVCPIKPPEAQEEPQVCPIKPPEPQVCPIKPPEVPAEPEPITKPVETPKATEPQTPEPVAKPQTPEAVTKPDIPEAAIKPQTPEAETKPVIPEAATKPQTPEAVVKPQTPEATTKPELPEVATKPQTPEIATKPQIPEAETKPQTPEAATKPETSPVESPIVPETPPVVAAPPKAPESSTPTPKPEEASAAAATETTATPTPPPRKGSGGSKKASKPKK